MPLMLPKAEIFEDKVREVYRQMTEKIITNNNNNTNDNNSNDNESTKVQTLGRISRKYCYIWIANTFACTCTCIIIVKD